MKKVVIYICLTAFLFGTMEVSLKLAGSGMDSLQLTFLRFFIGGLFLIPFGVVEKKQRDPEITAKDFGWLLLVGIMGIPVSMLCFQLGVVRCNAATASSLICLNPIFTMVIAHIFTEEKMDKNKGAAFVIALVAAFFMIRPWDVQPGNTPLGMGLMLIASVTFAAYTVMGKRSIGRIGTFAQTSISFILGSLVLLVIILFTHRPVIQGIAENWAAVLYVSFFVTGLGYMFYFLAIRYSDATTGSIAFFVKPAIAPVLAVMILHESVYWNTIVGIALLISASVITLVDTWRSRQIEDVDTEYESEIEKIFSETKPKVMGERRYFSCIIPCVEYEGKEHLLLEVRNEGEIHHPGEIVFPGGEMRPGEAPENAAVRLTLGDLGIDRKKLHVINQIDTFHGATGLTVFCFVGRLNDLELNPDEKMVQKTLLVPVNFFVEHDPEVQSIDIVQRPGEEFSNEKIGASEGYDWRKGERKILSYDYQGQAIWGITAMIVRDFALIIRKARKKKN